MAQREMLRWCTCDEKYMRANFVLQLIMTGKHKKSSRYLLSRTLQLCFAPLNVREMLVRIQGHGVAHRVKYYELQRTGGRF